MLAMVGVSLTRALVWPPPCQLSLCSDRAALLTVSKTAVKAKRTIGLVVALVVRISHLAIRACWRQAPH